ncbi:helix-turn-helix transcriptional regulator [Ralstonia nicotianae]|uniref:helix-turn-helix transcriptional regulator n=1 Tax=Ralstonia pseudosolanacearum TaxID=1310165 RepID=UPI000ABB2B5A|nr:helix-turn-helix domain-containing protein [Ralstonia pseudosolanacearum]NJZ83036.1 DNA-binding protein [Ralstonia solanacearum]MDO3513278.1 helix-turn-helix domain-containing protein [Ralstonia pseudosolanacearum]MDO3536493.1 helix-turn-helix domain-containing protein [Ralstonia pseudosolanacearum]MDO3605333.1 helix-turn-helix domain-containing protein [Ralstonia pseudosolanacearum]MDO3611772.1 helix-turn-helix domain-containing protein [Ralstonia pseudosolanacearum]
MAIPSSPVQLGRHTRRHEAPAPVRAALDETELAKRWGLSVKTLQRWRQDQLGPVFCKLGSRVTYLISEIEAFERRVSRNSTSVRAYH